MKKPNAACAQELKVSTGKNNRGVVPRDEKSYVRKAMFSTALQLRIFRFVLAGSTCRLHKPYYGLGELVSTNECSLRKQPCLARIGSA